MKKLLFLLLVSTHVLGQNVDYNKIILPENVRSPDFAERLVQLAWKNNPINEVLRREVAIAELGVKKNSAGWLDIIRVSGNLNEFNVNPQVDINNRSQFFPRYNIGASVTLGMFVNIPYNTRQDRQRVVIAEAQLDAQKLEMRNVVMKAYNDYIMYEKVYRIQAQAYSDIENSYKLVEQKFKNGEITFETYSGSQGVYHNATIALFLAEKDHKNAKLDLEKLIGIKLEDVR